jgi:hypothetical protein
MLLNHSESLGDGHGNGEVTQLCDGYSTTVCIAIHIDPFNASSLTLFPAER